MKNHRVFVIRRKPATTDIPEHCEWWSYDHYTPDDEENALEIPVKPGDVIVDGSALDDGVFWHFHDARGALRRKHGHEPEKLYELLDKEARVSVPGHIAPVGPDEETVYQPEFHRIVSRPRPDVLEQEAGDALLSNALERKRATSEGRDPRPTEDNEPVRAYWAVVRTKDAADGVVRRAVFPRAAVVHVFPGGRFDLAVRAEDVLNGDETLVGRVDLGKFRPGAAAPAADGSRQRP